MAKAIILEKKGEVGGEVRPSEIVKGRYIYKERDGVSFKYSVRITPNTNGLH